MTDPRSSIIDDRLKDIKNIVAVSSGKGGVGKSIVASVLALSLARKGFRVGLFDLDFTSPSTHVILGISGVQPKEYKGIVPPEVNGFRYMSITYYSRDEATPLRGADVTNALVELLSITRWGRLDYLILDMPPGIGDATLDLIRLVKDLKFLIVTTPSQLAFETVKKLVSLLNSLRIPVLGLIENMKRDSSQTIREQAVKLGLKMLASVPFDEKVEKSIGNGERLMSTEVAKEIKNTPLETHTKKALCEKS